MPDISDAVSWSVIPVKTKRRSRKSLSTLCSWCACNPAHTRADAHTKDADRVKSGLSLAYLPPSDLKLSVSDEEKRRRPQFERQITRPLKDFRKASSLNPQPADYGEKHWWERESVGEVLQEREEVGMCVCECIWGGKKKTRESYQSCRQSPGQVVIREAAVGISLSLSLPHTHIMWERKALLCSPLPPMSEHSAGVLGWGLRLYGSHLSTAFWGRETREGIQMVRPGEGCSVEKRGSHIAAAG